MKCTRDSREVREAQYFGGGMGAERVKAEPLQIAVCLCSGIVGTFLVHFFNSKQVMALDLTAPYYIETAQVLPAGVWDPQFLNVAMSIDSRFDGAGQVQPLGAPLNKNLTWQDLIGSQKSPKQQELVQATIKYSGVNPDGGPGSTTGVVNTYVDVKAPVLAVGVTDRLSLAAVVPIMNVSISADTGFVKSQDGQKWADTLYNLNADQSNVAVTQLNNAINQKLESSGYQPLQSRSFTAVGDVQLIGMYALYKDRKNLWTLKSITVLPTGTAPSADLAVDVPTGDGRLQQGLELLYERTLPWDLKWTSYGGYQALLPNQMVRRIPTEMNNPISADQEALTRNWGSQVKLGTWGQYQFIQTGLLMGAGYTFQFLSKTSYSGGTLYAPERYSYLEDLTPSETLHTGTLIAGFSTVEWYLNKKFFYPFRAYLMYSHPLAGRNVTTNDVLAGQFVLFF